MHYFVMTVNCIKILAYFGAITTLKTETRIKLRHLQMFNLNTFIIIFFIYVLSFVYDYWQRIFICGSFLLLLSL